MMIVKGYIENVGHWFMTESEYNALTDDDVPLIQDVKYLRCLTADEVHALIAGHRYMSGEENMGDA